MAPTKHGEKRVRKRIGVNKKAVSTMAEAALKEGITNSEAIGSLDRYFYYLYKHNEQANNIRVYANYVWIFHNNTLITVFNLPKKYVRTVVKIQDRRCRNEMPEV